MADIFEKCSGFTEAKEAIASGLYPYFIPLTENEGTVAVFRGHRLIMCGSNNYLGLTTHPKVRQAAIDAIARYGTSCTGSRFLNGTLEMHEQLEQELLRAMDVEGDRLVDRPTAYAIAHSVARILHEDHLRVAEQLERAGVALRG